MKVGLGCGFLVRLLRAFSVRAVLSKIYSHNNIAYARNPSAVSRITYD